MPGAKQSHIVVVGAGAFGGWTALFLRRQGARVTLLDSWGPGNSRASSGGETRVIRATYGSRAVYTRMAARAASDCTFALVFTNESNAGKASSAADPICASD